MKICVVVLFVAVISVAVAQESSYGPPEKEYPIYEIDPLTPEQCSEKRLNEKECKTTNMLRGKFDEVIKYISDLEQKEGGEIKLQSKIEKYCAKWSMDDRTCKLVERVLAVVKCLLLVAEQLKKEFHENNSIYDKTDCEGLSDAQCQFQGFSDDFFETLLNKVDQEHVVETNDEEDSKSFQFDSCDESEVPEGNCAVLLKINAGIKKYVGMISLLEGEDITDPEEYKEKYPNCAKFELKMKDCLLAQILENFLTDITVGLAENMRDFRDNVIPKANCNWAENCANQPPECDFATYVEKSIQKTIVDKFDPILAAQ